MIFTAPRFFFPPVKREEYSPLGIGHFSLLFWHFSDRENSCCCSPLFLSICLLHHLHATTTTRKRRTETTLFFPFPPPNSLGNETRSLSSLLLRRKLTWNPPPLRLEQEGEEEEEEEERVGRSVLEQAAAPSIGMVGGCILTGKRGTGLSLPLSLFCREGLNVHVKAVIFFRTGTVSVISYANLSLMNAAGKYKIKYSVKTQQNIGRIVSIGK